MPYRHVKQSDREMIDRMRFSGASLVLCELKCVV